MEEPALACYGSGRKGNLDYFFPSNGSSADSCVPREGVAVELNYNYDGHTKIKRDILKLIDPASAHSKSVYFAYGKRRKFFESVVSGIERAFNVFGEDRPEFRLPIGLHVIVVEYVRGVGHHIREARVAQTCSPTELAWTETSVHAIGEDGVAHENHPHSMHEERTVTKLGAPERKAWIHLRRPSVFCRFRKPIRQLQPPKV
jgi:hypothetical protein